MRSINLRKLFSQVLELIAKYSVEWVKDVINDFESIINLQGDSVPEPMDSTLFVNLEKQPEFFKKHVGSNDPYVLLCTNKSSVINRNRMIEYISHTTGKKIERPFVGKEDILLTDTRMINLYTDTYPGTQLLKVKLDGNGNFCKVYNEMFNTWKRFYQGGQKIDWKSVSNIILENIVRYVIDNSKSETFAETIKNERRFLLRPEEKGFIYNNRYFSPSQTRGYKLRQIHYFIVKHLYDHLGEYVHGTQLVKLVKSSKPQFKNGKFLEVNGALTTYFSANRQEPVKKLLDSLVESTGLHGAYRLLI